MTRRVDGGGFFRWMVPGGQMPEGAAAGGESGMMPGRSGSRELLPARGSPHSAMQGSGPAPAPKPLVTLSKLLISAGAIAVVLHAVDLPGVVTTLMQQNPVGLAIASAVMVVQVALGALRWHLVRVHTGISSSFIATFRMYYVGSFFGSYVWSGMSADIVRVWLSWMAGASRAAALNSTLLDRIASIAGIAVLMIVSAPWFLDRFGLTLKGCLPSLVAAALLLGIAGLAQLDRFETAWRRILALRLLGSLGAATREVFLRPRAAIPAIGTAMLGQIALAVATYAMAVSLRINIALIDCIVIMQIVALIVAIPVSVGGWGTRELSLVALLGLIGVPSSSALLLSVQLGVLGLAVNLPGGIFWLLLRPRAHGGMRAAPLWGPAPP